MATAAHQKWITACKRHKTAHCAQCWVDDRVRVISAAPGLMLILTVGISVMGSESPYLVFKANSPAKHAHPVHDVVKIKKTEPC